METKNELSYAEKMTAFLAGIKSSAVRKEMSDFKEPFLGQFVEVC